MWVLGVLVSGCGARRVELPSGPGTPFPDFAAVHKQLSAACSGVKTMTAELGLSGRARGERLRARVVAGFARPSSMRLEAVAAGQVFFILAAPGDNAVLYLPRANRVLRNQRPEAILAELTGVALAPADLQAILTGCVVPDARPTGGQLYPNGWASIDVGSTTLFLQRVTGQWQLRVARRTGWRFDYPEWQGSFPASVRLLSDAADAGVDLTAAIAQLETNLVLEPATFTVNVPPDADPLTLDEIRQTSPLQGP